MTPGRTWGRPSGTAGPWSAGRPAGVVRAVLAVAVVLAAGLVGVGAVPPGAGPAASAAGRPAAVAVDAIEPGVLRTGDTLAVRGRVTATGRQELRDVEVRLRLSTTRLGSRAELSAVAQGRTTSRDGVVVLSRNLPDLGVGQSESFDLARPVDELEQLTGFGVYVLGVEVLASRSSGFGRVALVRTLLPWVPADEVLVPTAFTWLWPLVGTPSRLADDHFADDSLAAEIGPEGRLTRLLDAGSRFGAGDVLTWAIDPELVAAVADMADGYQIRTGDGDLVDGEGAGAAISWLERLRVTTGGEPVLALPVGDVDLTAASRAGLGSDVESAIALGRTSLAASLPAADLITDVAWPANGYADRTTLATLRRSEVAAVVLDGRAVPPEFDLSYTPTGRAHVPTPAGRLAGLLAEPGLADLLRDRRPGPVLASQRLVAESAMIASELPSGPARATLVMPPRRWDPDQAYLDRLIALMTAAPWADAVSLRQLAATAPPEVDRGPLEYPRSQRRAELPPTYLTAVSTMHESVTVFSAILTDPTQYLPGLARSMLLLESTAWRGREARVNRLDQEKRYLADLRSRVRIQPANFTFSSRSGTIALTVANELDQAVDVSLLLEPQTIQLRLGAIEPRTFGPRSKEQVEVRATAVAPGQVLIDATLVTPRGQTYGQPVQLRIRVTEYGTVALYITVGAAAVLFLAAGIRVLRRVRGRRPGNPGGEGGEGGVGTDVEDGAPGSGPRPAEVS